MKGGRIGRREGGLGRGREDWDEGGGIGGGKEDWDTREGGLGEGGLMWKNSSAKPIYYI